MVIKLLMPRRDSNSGLHSVFFFKGNGIGWPFEPPLLVVFTVFVPVMEEGCVVAADINPDSPPM